MIQLEEEEGVEFTITKSHQSLALKSYRLFTLEANVSSQKLI